MEFKFNVNEVLKSPIVEINQNLIPPNFHGDRRALWETVTKVSEIVNALGQASASAQGLNKAVTTSDRLRNSDQTVYLLVDKNAKNGKGVVTGMLKTGKKSLYIFDRNGENYQVNPQCILDFYVHESRQRTGLGKQLFEHMLQKENTNPAKLAIDRPSGKLLSFLNKHYSLDNGQHQMNNFVVFDGFFPKAPEMSPAESLRTTIGDSESPNKTKPSANGLQQISSFGRYGAPRPPCSMGQIIHNTTSVQSNEPSGASQKSSNLQERLDGNSYNVDPNFVQSSPNFIRSNKERYGAKQNISQPHIQTARSNFDQSNSQINQQDSQAQNYNAQQSAIGQPVNTQWQMQQEMTPRQTTTLESEQIQQPNTHMQQAVIPTNSEAPCNEPTAQMYQSITPVNPQQTATSNAEMQQLSMAAQAVQKQQPAHNAQFQESVGRGLQMQEHIGNQVQQVTEQNMQMQQSAVSQYHMQEPTSPRSQVQQFTEQNMQMQQPITPREQIQPLYTPQNQIRQHLEQGDQMQHPIAPSNQMQKPNYTQNSIQQPLGQGDQMHQPTTPRNQMQQHLQQPHTPQNQFHTQQPIITYNQMQQPEKQIQQPLGQYDQMQQPTSPRNEMRQPHIPQNQIQLVPLGQGDQIQQPNTPQNQIRQSLGQDYQVHQPNIPEFEQSVGQGVQIQHPMVQRNEIQQPHTPQSQVQQPLGQGDQMQQPQTPQNQIQQPLGQGHQPNIPQNQVQQPIGQGDQMQQPITTGNQMQQSYVPQNEIPQPLGQEGQIQQSNISQNQFQRSTGQIQRPMTPRHQMHQPHTPQNQIQQPIDQSVSMQQNVAPGSQMQQSTTEAVQERVLPQKPLKPKLLKCRLRKGNDGLSPDKYPGDSTVTTKFVEQFFIDPYRRQRNISPTQVVPPNVTIVPPPLYANTMRHASRARIVQAETQNQHKQTELVQQPTLDATKSLTQSVHVSAHRPPVQIEQNVAPIQSREIAVNSIDSKHARPPSTEQPVLKPQQSRPTVSININQATSKTVVQSENVQPSINQSGVASVSQSLNELPVGASTNVSKPATASRIRSSRKNGLHETEVISPAQTQDRPGQMLSQKGQLHNQVTGEIHKTPTESATQSPKLERPRSLTIQCSEDFENLDALVARNGKNEVHFHTNNIEIEKKPEIVNDVESIDGEMINEDQDDTDRSKSPNPLTAQGFVDLKFYHSRLW